MNHRVTVCDHVCLCLHVRVGVLEAPGSLDFPSIGWHVDGHRTWPKTGHWLLDTSCNVARVRFLGTRPSVSIGSQRRPRLKRWRDGSQKAVGRQASREKSRTRGRTILRSWGEQVLGTNASPG